MSGVQLNIRIWFDVPLELLYDVCTCHLVRELTAVSETNAPCALGLFLGAVVVRESEYVGRVGGGRARGEPARLGSSKLEMNLGAGVDVSCADGFATQRAEGRLKCYIAQAISVQGTQSVNA